MISRRESLRDLFKLVRWPMEQWIHGYHGPLSSFQFIHHLFLAIQIIGREALRSNSDVVLAEYGKLGYVGVVFLFLTQDFGLPQRRPRVCFLFLKRASETFVVHSYEAYFRAITARMLRLRHEPPALTECMFDDDHDFVQNELTAKTIADNAKQNPAEQNWPKLHMDYYKDKGLRWGFLKAAQRTRASPWWGMWTEREKDVIACTGTLAADRHMCGDLTSARAWVESRSHTQRHSGRRSRNACSLARRSSSTIAPCWAGRRAPSRATLTRSCPLQLRRRSLNRSWPTWRAI